VNVNKVFLDDSAINVLIIILDFLAKAAYVSLYKICVVGIVKK
jgi:hypothetical protein